MALGSIDTEKELIQRSVKGDQLAFRKIYDQLSPKLYMIALRYMDQDSDAQDVLQDSFIRIHQKLDTFGFKGSFEGWCKRIAINTAIEHLRKKNQKMFSSLDNVQEAGVQAKSLENLKLEDLMKKIRSLPAGYRAVFNMYVIEGYSHKEIASELGFTESTSKSQLFKAKKYLKNLIQQES